MVVSARSSPISPATALQRLALLPRCIQFLPHVFGILNHGQASSSRVQGHLVGVPVGHERDPLGSAGADHFQAFTGFLQGSVAVRATNAWLAAKVAVQVGVVNRACKSFNWLVGCGWDGCRTFS